MKLLIIGAGGFATEIEELARLCGYRNIAFIDDNPNEARCEPVIGTVASLNILVKDWPNAIVALGNNQNRLMLHKKLIEIGFNIPVLRHPNAYISPNALIGNGSIVRCFAYVGKNVEIGDCTILNIGAKVDHDCIIGEGSHLLVGSVVRNSKTVKPLTWLNANTVIE